MTSYRPGDRSGKRIGRREYIDTWILATLRAREKGTEPIDELDKILKSSGIPRERFEDLCSHLIRSDCPQLEKVRVARGDGGIDAHL